MKKFLKICFLIIAFIPCFVLADYVHANNFHASVSKSKVSPNESVTVTIGGLSALRGKFNVAVGNGSGSHTFFAGGQSSESFSVTAGSSGTTTIDILAENVTTIDELVISGQRTRLTLNIVNSNSGGSGNTGGSGGSSGGSSNNGSSNSQGNNGGASSDRNEASNKAKDNLSSDNLLSSLSVSQGTLAPSFNADVMDYRLDLPSTATSLKIDAVAASDKATILGIGEHTLQAGENIIEVVCKAENGYARTYTIIVKVDEEPLVYTEYNGNRLGVVRNVSDVVVPEGFEETTVTLEGKEVKAWKNGINNLTLLYLSTEDGEKNFYLYDEQKGVISIYKPISLAGGNYAIVDIPQELQKRMGMLYREVQIDEYTMYAWKYEDSLLDNFTLLYLMNSKGEVHLYQYESTMNTLQLYNGNVAISQKNYDEMVKKQERSTLTQWIFIGGLIMTNIATLVGLFMSMKNKKRRVSKDIEVDENITYELGEEIDSSMSENTTLDSEE